MFQTLMLDSEHTEIKTQVMPFRTHDRSQASDPLLCSLRPQPSEFEEEASRRVDDLLESYMGIRDPELGKGPG